MLKLELIQLVPVHKIQSPLGQSTLLCRNSRSYLSYPWSIYLFFYISLPHVFKSPRAVFLVARYRHVIASLQLIIQQQRPRQSLHSDLQMHSGHINMGHPRDTPPYHSCSGGYAGICDSNLDSMIRALKENQDDVSFIMATVRSAGSR